MYKKLLPFAALIVAITSVASILYFILPREETTAPPANYAKPLTHEQIKETKAVLLARLENESPKASFAYLRKAINDDPSLARECHPLLHHLGHAAYEKYKDFNTTISYQDNLCNSGYTHGTIEAHFAASTDINETLKNTCTASKKLTFEQWQCFHGVGHGVMYYTNKDVKASIALCETLAQNAQKSCVNGVFMERFIVISHSGESDEHAEHIDAALCKDQPASYKPDCYTYAPTAYLSLHPNDYRGAFTQCEAVETTYRSTCIYGVGGQAMKENVLDPSIARDTCAIAPVDTRKMCAQGAIGILINHHGDTEPVKPLCSSVFSNYKTTCEQKINTWDESYAS